MVSKICYSTMAGVLLKYDIDPADRAALENRSTASGAGNQAWISRALASISVKTCPVSRSITIAMVNSPGA